MTRAVLTRVDPCVATRRVSVPALRALLGKTRFRLWVPRATFFVQRPTTCPFELTSVSVTVVAFDSFNLTASFGSAVSSLTGFVVTVETVAADAAWLVELDDVGTVVVGAGVEIGARGAACTVTSPEAVCVIFGPGPVVATTVIVFVKLPVTPETEQL